MKSLFKLLVCSMLLLSVTACSSDEEVSPTYLDVTYVNIAGVWKLSSWNGVEQNDNPYMYFVIDRKDLTFKIYQNLDSSTPRYISGVYKLNFAEYEETYISGYYDHASGLWNHDYYISKLTPNEMTWTATDNAHDVSVYVRCDEVPEEIVNAVTSRSDEKTTEGVVKFML